MTTIAWIGLGQMGLPMSRNLAAAPGNTVRGFDLNPQAVEAAARNGLVPAASIADAVRGADVVFTMLPKGDHVRSVYFGHDGVLSHAAPGTLLIDSSTIDVAAARQLHTAAATEGFRMVDAPVSGGISGADAGTLAFMIGG
ncbi:NAD(P)-binding domain-containing protein, partial [Raineyella sp.]|uniref:NAD(P)-dependent oxidoreductase n=1 Tax=Raineyella sp. TaxID=1911550 RepID=UPI002B2164D3